MKPNESAESRGVLVRDPSGSRGACWNSDPAPSAPAFVASFVVDSSGFPYCLCSYVEHSFLLTDTTQTGHAAAVPVVAQTLMSAASRLASTLFSTCSHSSVSHSQRQRSQKHQTERYSAPGRRAFELRYPSSTNLRCWNRDPSHAASEATQPTALSSAERGQLPGATPAL
jgi:hypothetical protein